MANGRGSKNDSSWRDGNQFALIPHHVLNSSAYIKLSHPAKGLILDLVMQLGKNGANNGKLICTETYMNKRGWKGRKTYTRAKRELIDAGFLFETVVGHRPNKASWYALTFFSLDMSFQHRYDAGSVGGFRRGAYDKEPLTKNAT